MIATIIKFVTCLIAYAVGLDLFFNAKWTDVLSFSVTFTVLSLIADKILLSRIGKGNTLMADFVLSYLVVWIFGSVLFHNYLQIAWGSIISAVIITLGESIAHNFIKRNEPERSTRSSFVTNKPAYGMEMAEEEEPVKKE